MNGLMNFAADSKVHDTVLITMVISSFLAAIRRFKETADPKAWKQIAKTFWNFLYDWATGFWSMKTGQPLHPTDPQQPGGPAQPKQ